MMLRIVILTLALLALPSRADWDFSAINQGNWYIGGQLNYGWVDTNFGDANPVALHVLGGYQFNPYIGIESRIGLGLADDEAADNIHIEVDSYYGLYLTGTLPMGDWVRLYALVGVTDLSLEQDLDSQSDTFGTSDLSYGLGLSLLATERLSFSLEFMQWLDKGEFDVAGMNLGVRYDF
ncbi:porin family protein [Ferrimonas balearica]|uniref:porin family protein n=1 Tax=Ferrimonas balearica TaxID=44012 RepID=UPI001C55A859|nr:porin family protein [Ferrimonas balearica]MBY6019575.1 porin family protein [Halomonas denitrificans]MBW3141430.1 porin family protein [Ferrimonas balearica]MBW3166404.1 porin family protein [Ferrimonas balearica]MBY6096641.1 porin family protein [Ferrimonas balearica]MBY6108474.1 porin family protein [Ferrimonas balearica]